jgi:hypothetical protein
MSSPTLALLKNKQKTDSAPQTDAIMSVAHEVENLTQEVAFQMVPALVEDMEFNLFRLGGILSVIRNHKWFGEHKNFKELVEKDFNMEYRKAMYFAEIYDKLLENDIPWESVKDVGWTKLRVLAKYLTLENVDYWVAQAKKLTFIQLIEALKQSAKTPVPNEDPEEGETVTTTVTTYTLKLHEDQKEVIKTAIERCKEETDTDFDNVALERICTGYLGGTIDIETNNVSVEESLKKMGYEKALDTFAELWPDINIVVQA